MNKDTLYEKHLETLLGKNRIVPKDEITISLTPQKISKASTNISIEYAISCLENVYLKDGYNNQTIYEKIEEQKQLLNK